MTEWSSEEHNDDARPAGTFSLRGATGSPQRARALTWRRIHGGPGTFSRAGASGNPSGWRRHSGARRIPDRNGGAQALYLLPRDHTFHGGAFYETGLLEWVFFSEDGTADYGFGPGMTYLPGRPWISPTTRVPYYTRGRLVTPRANYFLTPIVENQETLIPWPRYGLWEGTV
jgi:hypothetical protein